MTTINTLPVEICEVIACLAIAVHPRPWTILCLNSAWRAIAQPFLHDHIIFKSIAQISRFVACSYTRELWFTPSSITFTRDITTSDPTLFAEIARAFAACDREILKKVSMRLNSHVVGYQHVFTGLICIKCVTPLHPLNNLISNSLRIV